VSAPVAVRWHQLCDRLGVKPKQFATLIAVATVSVGAMATKAVFKPSKAAASVAVVEAEPATAAPRIVDAPRARIELTLETRPARDPFRPFFMVAEAAPAQGSNGSTAQNVTGNAAAPSGLLLRAIIAGEYAVIGEETVGVGDELVDGDGRRFTVEEIQERRVVLREGGRRAELGYARIAAKGASAPAGAKGGKK
jgi:hypothetical protein